jgi:membrane-associated protein
MDPVSWLEGVADGSPATLLAMVMLALFLDSLSVLGALLPGDLLLMVPSAAVGGSEALLVVAGGVAGTMLGYTTSYAVGRRAGNAIRNSWLGRQVGERRWNQAERLLRGPAGRTLVLVQFMPVLNYLVPLLAGTLKVPLKRFAQLTGAGAVMYCSLYVSLGMLAGGTGAALADSTGRIVALLVVALSVAVLGLTVLARAVHQMTEQDAGDGGDDHVERAVEQDPQRGPARDLGTAGHAVDDEPPNVADSSPCSAADAFSTGTGCRCP